MGDNRIPTNEELMNLDDDALTRMLMGEEAPAAEGAAAGQGGGEENPQGDNPAQAQPQAENTPAQQTPEAPQPPAQQPQQMVPLAAVHEERTKRQAIATQNQQLVETVNRLTQQLQGAQTQTQAPSQQAAPPQPLDFHADPQGAVNTVIQQALDHHHQQVVAPLQNQLQTVTSALQQATLANQRTQEVQQLAKDYPHLDVPAELALYDQHFPQAGHSVHPLQKLIYVQGAKAMDPDVQQAAVQSAAKAQAVDMTAQALTGNKGKQQATPVTLSGATPARQEGVLPDAANLSKRDILNMSEKDQDELLKARQR